MTDASVPERPDAAIAREEITRYYADRVAAAKAELAKALDAVAAAEDARAGWLDHGEITDDGPMAATMVVSHAIDRYQAAAQQVFRGGGDRDEARRLGDREKALRRWLTAQGYDLGALAEPPPANPGRRR